MLPANELRHVLANVPSDRIDNDNEFRDKKEWINKLNRVYELDNK